MNRALAIGIPTFVVLLGIFWNHQATDKLRTELRAEIGTLRTEMGTLRTEMGTLRTEMQAGIGTLRTEMATCLERIEAYLRQFYHELGRHDAEIDALKRRS